MDLWDARFVHELARSFRVIAYGNRGMGFPTASEKEFSIPLFARDASGMIRCLCGGKAHVLGWSMGANIAMELAIGDPEKVDRMVLYAGNCGGPRSVPSSPVIEELLSSPELTREMVVKSMFPPPEWNDRHPDIDEYYPRSRRATPDDVLERQLEADEVWEGCHDRLAGVRSPTLIMNGSEDLDCPVGNAYLLADLIPSSTLIVMEGGGHGMMYQFPERMAMDIASFLGKGRSGGGKGASRPEL